MSFFLSLFGLVSSGILLNNYRKNKDTTSTSYKFSIFGVIFFTLAVMGALIWGGISLSSKPSPSGTVVSVPEAPPARAASDIITQLNKSVQIVKAANSPIG